MDTTDSIDMKTGAVMAQIGSHQQEGASFALDVGKNHFWDKRFDWLRYLYDHLNAPSRGRVGSLKYHYGRKESFEGEPL